MEVLFLLLTFLIFLLVAAVALRGAARFARMLCICVRVLHTRSCAVPHAYVCVCCHTCLERAGFLALFKGMAAPLVSASLVNAITFGAYAQSQRVSCIIFCYQLRQLP